MRISIQFFGHTRTFRKTYRSFYKHVIDANPSEQIDMFMHTWSLDNFVANANGSINYSSIRRRERSFSATGKI